MTVRRFRAKRCAADACDATFNPTGPNAQYCDACRAARAVARAFGSRPSRASAERAA